MNGSWLHGNYIFTNEKKIKVRQGIKPGNSKTLWEAVKIANDQNIEYIPDQMKQNGSIIPNENLAEEFACMFEKKIKDIVSTTTIDDAVYNGVRKVTVQDLNFMSVNNIREAILSLKQLVGRRWCLY